MSRAQRSRASCALLVLTLSGHVRSEETTLPASSRWVSSRHDLLLRALAVDPRDTANTLEQTELAEKKWSHASQQKAATREGLAEIEPVTALLCVPQSMATATAAAVLGTSQSGNGNSATPGTATRPASPTVGLAGAQAVFSSRSEDAACFLVHDEEHRVKVKKTMKRISYGHICFRLRDFRTKSFAGQL